MKLLTALLPLAVICCVFPGLATADDVSTHTQLLQRLLSVLERKAETLEDHYVNREKEDDNTLDDNLERLAQILTRGSDVKVTNPQIANTEVQSTNEENVEARNSKMTEEGKDTVKKMIVSLMKKTKHCGPLGLDEICADSHDCCCGYVCWKWRCQEIKPKVNANWWEDLHLP